MSKTFVYERFEPYWGSQEMERENEGRWVKAEDAINREAVLQAQIRTMETQLKDAKARADQLERVKPLHWNPIYNTDPVQRACGELPEGWEVEISLEKGAGCVYLIDPLGMRTDVDSEDHFDWTIHEAIDQALATPE